MPTVELDRETHRSLTVASRLSSRSIPEIIRDLVARSLASEKDDSDPPGAPREPVAGPGEPPSDPSNPDRHADKQVAIYAVYLGHRVDGFIDLSNNEITVSTEPWSGRKYSSPTAAAIAVVERYSAGHRVSTNTNGRRFWKISSTKRQLRSLIGER